MQMVQGQYGNTRTYTKTMCWIQTHNTAHHLWNILWGPDFDDDTNMTKIAADTIHNAIDSLTKLSEFD